jgi:enolase
MKITHIIGQEIYDSRGWPTIQCQIKLENNALVTASVPAGITRSRHEAHESRDGGKRMWGRGISRALEQIDQIIAPELVGQAPSALEMDLKLLELDGTSDKSHLGANVTLAVSMALYRAQALVENLELYEFIAYMCGAESVSLPFPLFNIINGGQHINDNLQIQEVMIVPLAAENFRNSMEAGVTVFHELGNILHKHGKLISLGNEGSYSSCFDDDRQALNILMEALDKVEYLHHIKCLLALNFAASQFYNRSTKRYLWNNKELHYHELIQQYEQLIADYPIYSLEDPLSEDDWEGWQTISTTLDQRIQLVGDDLFATNPLRIAQGIQYEVANGVTIKPNQVGTITEALHAVRLCKQAQINTIIAHRTGETEDTFIADLAVGTSAGQIKAGGCCRGEHLAKYNRLLTIENNLSLGI